jgi:hypothetical protein
MPVSVPTQERSSSGGHELGIDLLHVAAECAGRAQTREFMRISPAVLGSALVATFAPPSSATVHIVSDSGGVIGTSHYPRFRNGYSLGRNLVFDQAIFSLPKDAQPC